MIKLPVGERSVIGADFNGHVGEGNREDEEIMGRYGYGRRNEEGQVVVDFAKRAEMVVLNTYFVKKVQQRITYKSGGRSSQVDYLCCKRRHLSEVTDCYVLGGECVAAQHKVVVCKMTLKKKRKNKRSVEPRIKWWRLGEVECRRSFNRELIAPLTSTNDVLESWSEITATIRETAKTVLGVTSCSGKPDKETWWWNKEVQESIKNKKEAKKVFDRTGQEAHWEEYVSRRKEAKREVAKAKEDAYKDLYAKLETKEGEKDLFRIAKQRDKASKDIQHVRVIKDATGELLTGESEVLERWKRYFESLMNTENPRETRNGEAERTENVVTCIDRSEIKNCLKKMKNGKAVGPDNIPVEAWKSLGNLGVDILTNLFNSILECEEMPNEWRKSMLIPVYKNKEDAQECGNYRGIKLMSHNYVWVVPIGGGEGGERHFL